MDTRRGLAPPEMRQAIQKTQIESTGCRSVPPSGYPMRPPSLFHTYALVGSYVLLCTRTTELHTDTETWDDGRAHGRPPDPNPNPNPNPKAKG